MVSFDGNSKFEIIFTKIYFHEINLNWNDVYKTNRFSAKFAGHRKNIKILLNCRSYHFIVDQTCSLETSNKHFQVVSENRHAQLTETLQLLKQDEGIC